MLHLLVESLKGIEDRCAAKAETYAERNARFEAELAGLKESLKILEGKTMRLEQTPKRALRGVRLYSAQ